MMARAFFALFLQIAVFAPASLALAQTPDAACQSIGQREADARGATLVAANRVGEACEITLLLPAQDGQRPAREVFTVARSI